LQNHMTPCRLIDQLLTVHMLAAPVVAKVNGYSVNTTKFKSRDHTSLNMAVLQPENLKKGEKLPIFIEFHGGGHHIFNEYALWTSEFVIVNKRYIVFSPEYRMAPEFRFPTAPEDCYDALKWVVANAEQYGGDVTKISVGGSSAGGNLAAAITIMARDRNFTHSISANILHVPLLDFFLESESYSLFMDTPFWDTKYAIAARRSYIPSAKDWSDPRASPVRAESHKNLPPTMILTCKYDPLRDDGIMYKEKLEKSKVKVGLIENECYHATEVLSYVMFGQDKKLMEDTRMKVQKFLQEFSKK